MASERPKIRGRREGAGTRRLANSGQEQDTHSAARSEGIGVELSKTEDSKQTSKAAKGKCRGETRKERATELTADSWFHRKPRWPGESRTKFQNAKRKENRNYGPRILCEELMSFKGDGSWRTFPDKTSVKGLGTSRRLQPGTYTQSFVEQEKDIWWNLRS